MIVDGDRIPGWFTLEGPKLYRHDGWFWIFAPAGGVETGWQGAFRSREFFGPYEERIVLEQRDTDVNGPHQGGWVRTPSGEDWFLHFQQRGAYGRVVHLQPMRWGADGWPVLGDDGAPVAVHRKPDLPAAAARRARHRRRLPRRPLRPPVAVDGQPAGRLGHPALRRRAAADLRAHRPTRTTCAACRTSSPSGCRAIPSAVEVELRLTARSRGRGPGSRCSATRSAGSDSSGAPTGRSTSCTGSPRPVAERERDADHPRPAPEGRARLRIEIGAGARCRFSYDVGDGLRPSGPGLRRHPLALGRRPARPLRPRARRRRDTPGRPRSRSSGSDHLVTAPAAVRLLGAAMTHLHSKRLPRPGARQAVAAVLGLVAALCLGTVGEAQAAAAAAAAATVRSAATAGPTGPTASPPSPAAPPAARAARS